jgi:glycine/D-amino acid oxidase-like deaminating enzyme
LDRASALTVRGSFQISECESSAVEPSGGGISFFARNNRKLQSIRTYMSASPARDPWGVPPWKIDFRPPKIPLPSTVDVAIVGGGFSGLAAAAWLRLLSPDTSVALFEASHIGAGASGRTGGLALAESAAGDLPGLGDVLAGTSSILQKLDADADLVLPGAWEVARGEATDQAKNPRFRRSPIEWNDSGALRVVNEVPGGTVDPGKMVSSLARAAHRLGAGIFENQPVRDINWHPQPILGIPTGQVRAKKVLIATSALSLHLSNLAERVQPRFTLAASTAPLSDQQLGALGLEERKPFYTVDLPYLWGRLCADNSIVWGAGLVSPPKSGDLTGVDVAAAEPSRMFASLERRVRGLHPVLATVRFTHSWGGPISFRENWSPAFEHHPQSHDGIVLGAYAGHGVALSVYLGAWAAEAILSRRELPAWGRLEGSE